MQQAQIDALLTSYARENKIALRELLNCAEGVPLTLRTSWPSKAQNLLNIRQSRTQSRTRRDGDNAAHNCNMTRIAAAVSAIHEEEKKLQHESLFECVIVETVDTVVSEIDDL